MTIDPVSKESQQHPITAGFGLALKSWIEIIV
jgi:hypothetical protein